MKILLIAPQPFFQDRGTPIAVKLMTEILAELGNSIHLVVYHEGEDIKIPNVTLHRIPALPGIKDIKPGLSLKKIICDMFIFFKCLPIIIKHKISLIHAVEESVFLAVVIKFLFGLPFIYDMDSCLSIQIIDKFPLFRPARPLIEFFEKMALRYSNGAIVVCKSLEDIAHKFAPGKLISRLEDVSLLTKTARGDEYLRTAYNISGPIVMYVGNLEKYQGIDLLIDAFQQVLNRGCKANLVIIGGSDGDIDIYKQRVQQLGVADNIFFCGPRPISLLGYYLSQADILVSPRIQGNNTPMKIYSYLDSGKAVLATRLPTHTQVLDEDISLLVNPNPGDMANGMFELLSDEALRNRLSLNARQKVRQEYSISAYRAKVTRFYTTLTTELKLQ